MEMAVWEVPGDVQDKAEYPDMVDICMNLWKEHHISRAATPEVRTSLALDFFPDVSQQSISLTSGSGALARSQFMGRHSRENYKNRSTGQGSPHLTTAYTTS